MRRVLLAITGLGLAAAALGAAGIAMLAGLGWTLIFLAVCCVAVAVLLARGLSNG